MVGELMSMKDLVDHTAFLVSARKCERLDADVAEVLDIERIGICQEVEQFRELGEGEYSMFVGGGTEDGVSLTTG